MFWLTFRFIVTKQISMNSGWECSQLVPLSLGLPLIDRIQAILKIIYAGKQFHSLRQSSQGCGLS